MAGEALGAFVAGVSLQGGSIILETDGEPVAIRLTTLVTQLVEKRMDEAGGELDDVDRAYLMRVADELELAAKVLKAGAYTKRLPATHR